MFRELCGEGALKNVCIATTNWGRVTQKEGDMRERELRESSNLFKPLLDAGAQLFRHDKEAASAQSIVNYLIHKDPTKLQIQVELDEGKTLEETRAGSVLTEEIKELMKRHKIDMQLLQKEMEEAAKDKQVELLEELEEERQRKEQQMLKSREDLRKLKKWRPTMNQFVVMATLCADARWIVGLFVALVLLSVVTYQSKV